MRFERSISLRGGFRGPPTAENPISVSAGTPIGTTIEKKKKNSTTNREKIQFAGSRIRSKGKKEKIKSFAFLSNGTAKPRVHAYLELFDNGFVAFGGRDYGQRLVQGQPRIRPRSENGKDTRETRVRI